MTCRIARVWCRRGQRKRQLDQAVEHLRTLEVKVARKVVKACARELTDLGLLDDVKKSLV